MKKLTFQQVLTSIVVTAMLLCTLVLTFTGCKTPSPTVIRKDSLVYKTRIDSVTLLRYDSVYIHQKGDTLYLEKYKTIFKDQVRIKTDTIYANVEKPVEVIKVERYIPKWCYWLAGIGLLIIIIWLFKMFKKLGII